jgi:hypothetical protein
LTRRGIGREMKEPADKGKRHGADQPPGFQHVAGEARNRRTPRTERGMAGQIVSAPAASTIRTVLTITSTTPAVPWMPLPVQK